LGHWLADVLVAVFVGTFAVVERQSECSRKLPNTHIFRRYGASVKKNKDINNKHKAIKVQTTYNQ